jgi:hypothetical protein
MKTKIKNNRKKAIFGIDDALFFGLLSTAISGIGAGASIYNTRKQTQAQQAAIDAENAARIKSTNLQNSTTYQQNVMNTINQEHNPNKNIIIPTQTSQLKLGGRRCKRVGGRKSFIGKCI